MVIIRGGVEEIRLEAKDTKKILRQRQTLFRSKPDLLEAKDTGSSVLQKKGLQNNFSGDLQKIFKLTTKFQLLKKLCCPQAKDRAIFEDLRL